MERLRLWNDTVDEVNKITRPLVGRKIAAIIRENNLPEIFNVQVNHDITLLCMEAEYADVCPPGFFENRVLVAQWTLPMRLVGRVSRGEAGDLLISPSCGRKRRLVVRRLVFSLVMNKPLFKWAD
jgi:hypothetical protein